MSTKIALGIVYDGSTYHGWQRQPTTNNTLQSTLELALSKVAQQEIFSICAGRTDAGVHALGQVVHFETSAARSLTAWVKGTNFYLPANISVQWAQYVPTNFSARFTAQARQYHYVIYNRSLRPSILRNYVTWEPFALNADLMQQAANFLIGEHDFSSFRARDCQSKSTQRNVMWIKIIRQKHLVIIDIKANAFLHHMVRNIAGVLMAIGKKKFSPQWAFEVLKAKDRTQANITAPPSGLFLVHVDYPEEFKFPHAAIDASVANYYL